MGCCHHVGVWTESGKIAATGIRATRWISYHGIALNVSTDLSPFDDIVPCGIQGRPVASVESHLEYCGHSLDRGGVALQLNTELVAEYSYAILEAFQDEFEMVVNRTEYELD